MEVTHLTFFCLYHYVPIGKVNYKHAALEIRMILHGVLVSAGNFFASDRKGGGVIPEGGGYFFLRGVLIFSRRIVPSPPPSLVRLWLQLQPHNTNFSL